MTLKRTWRIVETALSGSDFLDMSEPLDTRDRGAQLHTDRALTEEILRDKHNPRPAVTFSTAC